MLFFYDTRKYVSWKGAALIHTYCCCVVCPFVSGILRKVEASNLKKIQYAAAHAPALCHQFMDPLYAVHVRGVLVTGERCEPSRSKLVPSDRRSSPSVH